MVIYILYVVCIECNYAVMKVRQTLRYSGWVDTVLGLLVIM